MENVQFLELINTQNINQTTCPNCSTVIHGDNAFCINCGVRCRNTTKKSMLKWIILGVIEPVVGLILSCVVSLIMSYYYKKNEVGRAIACSKGAVIGVIIKLAIFFSWFVSVN